MYIFRPRRVLSCCFSCSVAAFYPSSSSFGMQGSDSSLFVHLLLLGRRSNKYALEWKLSNHITRASSSVCNIYADSQLPCYFPFETFFVILRQFLQWIAAIIGIQRLLVVVEWIKGGGLQESTKWWTEERYQDKFIALTNYHVSCVSDHPKIRTYVLTGPTIRGPTIREKAIDGCLAYQAVLSVVFAIWNGTHILFL